MVSQLVNSLWSIKHCFGVYEHNSIVNSIRADDWTAELAIIAGTVSIILQLKVQNDEQENVCGLHPHVRQRCHLYSGCALRYRWNQSSLIRE